MSDNDRDYIEEAFMGLSIAVIGTAIAASFKLSQKDPDSDLRLLAPPGEWDATISALPCGVCGVANEQAEIACFSCGSTLQSKRSSSHIVLNFPDFGKALDNLVAGSDELQRVKAFVGENKVLVIGIILALMTMIVLL